jgi:hypothetical protein
MQNGNRIDTDISNYEAMTVKQLRQEIRDRGIGLMYVGEMKRAELLNALQRHDRGMSASKPLAGWDDYGKRKPVGPRFETLTPVPIQVGIACDDCVRSIESGEYTGMDGARATEVRSAVAAKTAEHGALHIGTDNRFCWFPCDVCKTELAGNRHEVFAVTDSPELLDA